MLLEQGMINSDALDYSGELIRIAHTARVKDIVATVTYRAETRDLGFRRAVVNSYDHRCALCGIRILTPDMHTVVDAAHIQPWSESKNDDVRNGMALCKTCHWAFDEFMISVSESYTVMISKQLSTNLNMPGLLVSLEGRGIITPEDKSLWPSQEYLGWHRAKVFV